MREKYESLQLAQLKELAKVRGLKGTSLRLYGTLLRSILLHVPLRRGDNRASAGRRGLGSLPAV
mgnify:CR=1 FL=1